jgi:hypothetical protein
MCLIIAIICKLRVESPVALGVIECEEEISERGVDRIVPPLASSVNRAVREGSRHLI